MKSLNVTSKKIIIPTIMLAGSIAAGNAINNKKNISTEATFEYMDKNPISQSTKAGILALLGFGKKRKKEEYEINETDVKETKNNIECWKKIKNMLRDLPEDLYYEKEKTDAKINDLIEKVEKEAVDKELATYIKKGLEYIKKNSNDIAIVDTSGSGHFMDDSRYLHKSIIFATQAALYPELIKEQQKDELQGWIQLGQTYMNENQEKN